MSLPRVGEWWWVAEAGENELLKRRVTDITPNTIEITNFFKLFPSEALAPNKKRYEHGVIKFVEKCNEEVSK